MRIPLSWLREIVEIPADVTAAEIADALTGLGFEEEEIDYFGSDLRGPVVVGQVLEFVEEPQANGKTIRWCQVDVGGKVHGIVCGARNFFVGDKVVVSLPGAVLPGGFAIAARKTYGHTSDGMICSARELQFSDDHDGIIRLGELGLDPALGTDAIELLGLRDEVIDASVLPDRGYAMSMRGIARELAALKGWKWQDPADLKAEIVSHKEAVNAAIVDETAASRIVLRTVSGFDASVKSPIWMQRRLFLCGMRSISFAVDVTNYVMLEMGQPLHAFDADKLKGAIKVERAGKALTLKTLDEVDRTLDPNDIVIADDSGAIALAGTMGGASTEISDSTQRIVIEAARFSAADVARTSRSHKLSSEASRRFERGVDAALPPYASARAVALLAEFGGAKEIGGVDVDKRPGATVINMAADYPSRRVGADFSTAEVVNALQSVGCKVSGTDTLSVEVPSWRTDLIGSAELSEEVVRLCGYERIPSTLPSAPPGLGLTHSQRLRRDVARLLAEAGVVEVLSYPFMGDADLDAMRIEASDARRNAVILANPITSESPAMRTTILAPLLNTAKRNAGRGHKNVAVYELGLVVLSDGATTARILGTSARPSDAELAALNAEVPVQPWYVGAVLSGAVERGQAFNAPSENWDWQSTIALAQRVVNAANASAEVVATVNEPWHPGRCGAIAVDGAVIGFAGELHPRVVEAFGLPARACAFEIDLDALALMSSGVVAAQPVFTFPKATQDVALVVDEATPVESLRRIVEKAAGDLLEKAEVFDIYIGEPVPAGKKSVAIALTFRVGDRTLTDAEVLAAREAAIAAAAEAFGAIQRA